MSSDEPAVETWRAALDGERRRFEDLLACIELYIDWHYVTKQLTTEQKELWADAVDASSARMHANVPGEQGRKVPRWWREDHPTNHDTKDQP